MNICLLRGVKATHSAVTEYPAFSEYLLFSAGTEYLHGIRHTDELDRELALREFSLMGEAD